MSDRASMRDFRNALGTFLTGVTVVTTLDPAGAPRGFTANSFTSVSLDPPLILICVARHAASSSVFCKAEKFAVNVLADDQIEISSRFSSKTTDRFKYVEWRPGKSGSPVLAGIAAWFDCFTDRVIEAGDHLVIIGHVLDFCQMPKSPLGYCRGAYLKFSLSQDAVAASGARIRVGAILERDAKIALIEDRNGTLSLPTGSLLEPITDPGSLRGRLNSLGLEARLEFLFSVFESRSPHDHAMSIYYRGELEASIAEGGAVRLIGFSAIDFGRVGDADERSMLRRFVKQRSENSFEIFAGTNEGGRFHHLERQMF